MNKTVDDLLNSALSHLLSTFMWYIAGISAIILIALGAGFSFIGGEFNVFVFIVYSVVSGICGIVTYFAFFQKGHSSGKMTEAYISNSTQYNKLRSGRMRADVSDFLIYAKSVERDGYIRAACGVLGVQTIDDILSINLRKQKDYTHRQRRIIRVIQRRKFPSVYPDSPARVLRVLGSGRLGSHGVKPDAKKKFIVRSSAQKLFFTLLITSVSGAIPTIFIVFGGTEAILKISLGLIGLGVSIIMGYYGGIKSTADIEKDILGGMILFLTEMDLWQAQQPKHSPNNVIPTIAQTDAPSKPVEPPQTDAPVIPTEPVADDAPQAAPSVSVPTAAVPQIPDNVS
jgi:hypothetical protein